jgi:hypothetical protein
MSSSLEEGKKASFLCCVTHSALAATIARNNPNRATTNITKYQTAQRNKLRFFVLSLLESNSRGD